MNRITELVLDIKSECDRMTDEEIHRAKEEVIKECVDKYGEANANFINKIFQLITR